MKINVTYPPPAKEKRLRLRMIRALKWPFLFAGYICPVINLATGGKAWSVIVLWSLWMAWSMVVSPALVEYNRISQFIKLTANACILLILIDLLLAPGWAREVVPILCFAGLLVAGLLFFTDSRRQRQNVFPMLLFVAATMVFSIFGLLTWGKEGGWALAVMGALALALLAGCAFALGPSFIREVKKWFHAG